jgi:plastocyanin
MFPKGLRPLMAVVVAGLAACGGSAEQAPPSPPAAGALKVDASTAGTITGRAIFDGIPPRNPVQRLSGDPACTREHPDGYVFDNYIVTDGGLENVFVYVKDGLGKYDFDVPAEPVKLDQKGCRYTPHVLGVRVGQPIEVSNSDDTMHNVHALPDVNGEINIGQHKKGLQNRHIFTAAEVMVPFKCDLHGWMTAYLGVVEHPYFSVTTSGGRFELKGLPPGTYTIEAWHEKSGIRTQQVTIAASETRDVNFTFAAPTSTN